MDRVRNFRSAHWGLNVGARISGSGGDGKVDFGHRRMMRNPKAEIRRLCGATTREEIRMRTEIRKSELVAFEWLHGTEEIVRFDASSKFQSGCPQSGRMCHVSGYCPTSCMRIYRAFAPYDAHWTFAKVAGRLIGSFTESNSVVIPDWSLERNNEENERNRK